MMTRMSSVKGTGKLLVEKFTGIRGPFARHGGELTVQLAYDGNGVALYVADGEIASPAVNLNPETAREVAWALLDKADEYEFRAADVKRLVSEALDRAYNPPAITPTSITF